MTCFSLYKGICLIVWFDLCIVLFRKIVHEQFIDYNTGENEKNNTEDTFYATQESSDRRRFYLVLALIGMLKVNIKGDYSPISCSFL
jgi:hypothetical protein